MSLDFSISSELKTKKGLSFDMMAKLSPLRSMLSLTAPTFSFIWQDRPEETGSNETSSTGCSTTPSSSSDAGE